MQNISEFKIGDIWRCSYSETNYVVTGFEKENSTIYIKIFWLYNVSHAADTKFDPKYADDMFIGKASNLLLTLI